MPGTFSNDFEVIQDAEVVANYAVVGTFKTGAALNNDYLIEGANAITSGVSRGTGDGAAGLMGFLPTTGATTLSANSATPAFTRAAGSFVTDGFRPGQRFVASGFTNAGNNATWTVSAVVALTLTVTAAGGMVTETGDGNELLTSVKNVTTGGNHCYCWIKLLLWPGSATQAQGGQRIGISSTASPAQVRAVNKAVVAAGGTGYTLSDELTLSGGTQTQAAVVIVTGVSSGVVTTVSPKATARGSYTALPANPISTTGGTGSGCTLTVTGTGKPASDGGDPGDWIYCPDPSHMWFVGGKDTVVVDGWVCYVFDPNGTPDLQVKTVTKTAINRVGEYRTIINTSTIASHVLDASHYGTGITVVDGTSGSPVTLADLLAYDNTSTRAFGLLTKQNGIYFLAGKVRVGTSGQSAVTYFADTNQVIVFLGFPVATAFYELVFAGAGSFSTTFKLGTYAGGVASGGVTIKGADRYTLYGGVATGTTIAVWTLTANAANTICLLYACIFSEMLSAIFNTSSELRFCTIRNSGTITAGGATIDSCTFLDLRKTSPISATYQISVTTTTPIITNSKFINCATAVLWDRNADTNGKLDGCAFTSGGTGHAIELGANTPSSITLNNVIFTSYGADATTDAAIYNNSGKAITITITGTGSTPTVRNGTGASTTVVTGSVSVAVTVKTETGTAIQNVRVLVTADTGGPFPSNVTVTIANSGTTATVTHTTHGLATNDKIEILGASFWQNNGVFSITVTGANTYTYTLPSDPGGNPTGTIKATFTFLEGLTDASGVISMSRVVSSAQPISGRARKSTATPYYKTGAIAGSVSSSTGFSTTVLLVKDE